MKYLHLIWMSLAIQLAFGQAKTDLFQEVAVTDFRNVIGARCLVGDLDGDGAQDLIIDDQGRNSDFKEFHNNGSGDFNFQNSGLASIPIKEEEVFMLDADLDGDLDLLIRGEGFDQTTNKSFPQELLYKNDGRGNYTKAAENPTGVEGGREQFVDLDGDKDLDLLVIILDPELGLKQVKKLINQGDFTFTEVESPGLNQNRGNPVVKTRNIVYADLDKDGDQDLIATQDIESSLNYNKYIYLNDGKGAFTRVMNEELQFPYPLFFPLSVRAVDLDNDGDVDLIDSNFRDFYENDGTGSFTKKAVSIHQGHRNSYPMFTDIDGDKDIDILVSDGRKGTLLRNDGKLSFTEIGETPFIRDEANRVTFVDIDNDGDKDVLASNLSNYIKLYKNTLIDDTPAVEEKGTSISVAPDCGSVGNRGLHTTITTIKKGSETFLEFQLSESLPFEIPYVLTSPSGTELARFNLKGEETHQVKLTEELGSYHLVVTRPGSGTTCPADFNRTSRLQITQ